MTISNIQLGKGVWCMVQCAWCKVHGELAVAGAWLVHGTSAVGTYKRPVL